MSTWGWVFEYGLVALLFLVCMSVIAYLWGQERWVRWLDHRAARREARSQQPEVDPK